VVINAILDNHDGILNIVLKNLHANI
jgi:hypothetical protein